MSDAVLSIATPVVDVEDAPTAPLRRRTATEEFVMHVLTMGVWHRRTPDMTSTACGVLYHSQFTPTRREELCHPLCPSCFTAYEILIANARDEKENG